MIRQSVNKDPTFLKVYVMPVLLLTLALIGWTLASRSTIQGIIVYLGYALIVAVGLRLYLAYLDHHYLRSAGSVQSGRKAQHFSRRQVHHHKSEPGQGVRRESPGARRVAAEPGQERRQPGQIHAGVMI